MFKRIHYPIGKTTPDQFINQYIIWKGGPLSDLSFDMTIHFFFFTIVLFIEH